MNFSSSFSEPNVNCFAYVCLVDNMTPTNKDKSKDCESGHCLTTLHVIDNKYEEVGTSKDDDPAIEVQRSRAFHELIDCNRKLLSVDNDLIEDMDSKIIFSPAHVDKNSHRFVNDGDAKILNLTRNKWLSESRDGSPDARLSLLTPSASETSDSECQEAPSAADNVLSTVLALDKEHNLFGLSHMKIEEPTKWRLDKEKKRAVFHQTAIVNVCYKRCCGRRSKSDLPQSLKCGSSCGSCSSRCGSCSTICSTCAPCGSSCVRLSATPCGTPCPKPCGPSGKVVPPPRVPCMIPRRKPRIPMPCSNCTTFGCVPSICRTTDCAKFGVQMTVHKVPEYEPTYTELESKARSVLHKPMAARSCHHTPRCQPPSNCFPYLMPCYWPARPGAPCSEPSRCFHNPPCPRRRAPRSKIDPRELCPTDHPCTGTVKEPAKCENLSCIGRNNDELKKVLAQKYGTKSI